MALKPSASMPKPSILSLIFLSLTLLFLTLTFRSQKKLLLLQNESQPQETTSHLTTQKPRWYDVVKQEIESKKIKIGLVNMDDEVTTEDEAPHGLADSLTTVVFDRVAENHRWEDFFPEWIDEDERWHAPKCPDIPMPQQFGDYGELDVVVATVPCGSGLEREGVRDVFRLQVNLVVANLVTRSGSWESHDREIDRTVYVVFVGSCGPMWEIFRCDDLLWHEGNYWVYKPDLKRLKQKMVMPVGTCQLALPYAEPTREVWRKYVAGSIANDSLYKRKEAYVTVLHSSEAYVCGAIALAQSIIQTNSTKDLVLLADNSISAKSLQGLKAAGWKIKRIQRIRSPQAKRDAYNEWNYSKLQMWRLIEYDKLIFVDADLLVLRNMDEFFIYPQLSAVGNDKFLFNSGVMVVEPSECTYQTLMKNRFAVDSYNGGDQGFLNEVFTWWHRLPSRLNHLKIFSRVQDTKHEVPKDVYAIHYLGLKPWVCYKDYDCNWDMFDHQHFASDSAHRRWWQVYEAMPRKLKQYCALTKRMNARIQKWRERAKNARLSDGHWKIKVKDPRQYC
ncbi:putative UDP-glucuronate:xylan alpha-glucuronosyltransferase 4 [Cornus florida]|uniref:putative UDP-glucuronate:xylan alpha-glucuronosyltransferase 4 n=1 Tax=Cornus florida TaxID=4283 RepID=UPI00289782DD|nr:putative UDP-glucuronate:xylan alpha-glucuronosyltransferase 4 [Cornus florida]